MKWNIISEYKIKKRFDIFDNMSKGMYSSVAMFFDIEKEHLKQIHIIIKMMLKNSNHINNDGRLLTN